VNKATRVVLNQILERAKTCKIKGRLYKYEQFKQELLRLNLDNEEYEQACIEIARLLEV